MLESEIKIVGKNKIKRIPDFKKSDGDVEIGKIFICYPHEIEELQQYQTKYESLKGDYNSLKEKYIQSHETSKSLGEDVESKRQTIEEMDGEIKSLKSQLEELETYKKRVGALETQLQTIKHDKDILSNKHETQQKTIQRLEDENTEKDEEISQLKSNIDDLDEEKNGLNTTITSTRIKHEEEMEHLNHEFGDLVSKYNESVDMIHSLISTTTLMKSDIENMGVINRNIGFKKHVNNIFEERNLDILIEQHLIEEDSTIPKKLPNKHP